MIYITQQAARHSGVLNVFFSDNEDTESDYSPVRLEINTKSLHLIAMYLSFYSKEVNL